MKVRLLVLSVVAILLAFAAPGFASANPGGECKNVAGRGVGQDLGGGDTAAIITNDGLLKGSTTAHFDIVGGAPVAVIAGVVTFETHKGTLTVTVAGTFDLQSGAFTASGPVTGGTGKFAGASGSMTFDGKQTPAGAFTETLRGRVCLDKGRDS